MREFVIDGSDFGVDVNRSECSIGRSDGCASLEIEVYGSEANFQAVLGQNPATWSAFLDPPHFYLRAFPAFLNTATGIVTASVDLDDSRAYDAAIYMMEHCDIEDVAITLVQNTSLEIAGQVHLLGKATPFTIRWDFDS